MIILEKRLSKTDISRRLAVPMEYFNMEHFPKPAASLEGNPREDFVVKDEKGRDWNLSCSIRKQSNHPKPVLINQWIHFVQSKKLREGDRVIIYGEQDETGLMQLRIKAEKCTGGYEAPCFPSMNQNPDRNKGLSSHSSSIESTATFQPSETEDHSAEVLSHELGQTTATTTPGIDKEHIPTTNSTSQDIARYKMKRPRLSSSLELTLKPTTTEYHLADVLNHELGRTTATKTPGIDKEHIPTTNSTSLDIARYKMKRPRLSLRLELTLKPTTTEYHLADVLNHELGQTTATTTPGIDKEHIPTTNSTSQDIARYKMKRPRLSSSLELTLKPTTTEYHLADVLNHELGQITATTTPSITKEHIPTNHSTSQDIARHKTKGPRLSPSLELTLKPATTEGMTAATSSSIDKSLAPTFHSHSQDIGSYNTETPNLSLNLGLTLKPTYMQDTTHK
ncbi:hypothetical protein Goshw_007975 [Gossypium schwendimanii]|uniref:TF-B3 domain-containing protein n=1 Tax=Gossypium schwendimanii TaxID=34291 RepID=A0A7J9KR21_GOSSC|nr:hypothetical protein [Gossypium schwendimanii]